MGCSLCYSYMRMNAELLIRIGFALLVFAFAVAGVGWSIWLGRRRTIGVCSCEFDAAAERRKGRAGCCGGSSECADSRLSSEKSPECRCEKNSCAGDSRKR